MNKPTNPMDLVRCPFLLARRLTRPVMDVVENYLGEEIEQIVNNVPGFHLMDEMCRGFNEWVDGKKQLTDPVKNIPVEEPKPRP